MEKQLQKERREFLEKLISKTQQRLFLWDKVGDGFSGRDLDVDEYRFETNPKMSLRATDSGNLVWTLVLNHEDFPELIPILHASIENQLRPAT